MPERVPCTCTEVEAAGRPVTEQCAECHALQMLGLTRSDVEHLPLLYASNRALAERCVRLEGERDFALKKERSTRAVSQRYLEQRRKTLYALHESGIDIRKVPDLARQYEARKNQGSD